MPARDRARDRLAQRVGGRRLGHRMAERQVDDADVVARRLAIDPVDAGDDVARQADAVRRRARARRSATPPARCRPRYAGVTIVAAVGCRRRSPRGACRGRTGRRSRPARSTRDSRARRRASRARCAARCRSRGSRRRRPCRCSRACRTARAGPCVPCHTVSAAVTLFVTAMPARTGRSPEMCSSEVSRCSVVELGVGDVDDRAAAGSSRNPRG